MEARCKRCSNFQPDVRTEIGSEISPNVKSLKGKCFLNNKSCGALDKCGCGGFTKKS